MGLIGSIITSFLRQSSRVHVRIEPAQTSRELVELMGRFVFENEMRYPLEWDDFISWKNTNSQAEEVRQRLAVHERLLFSRDKKLN